MRCIRKWKWNEKTKLKLHSSWCQLEVLLLRETTTYTTRMFQFLFSCLNTPYSVSCRLWFNYWKWFVQYTQDKVLLVVYSNLHRLSWVFLLSWCRCHELHSHIRRIVMWKIEIGYLRVFVCLGDIIVESRGRGPWSSYPSKNAKTFFVAHHHIADGRAVSHRLLLFVSCCPYLSVRCAGLCRSKDEQER